MNTSTYNRTRWLTLFGTIVTQFALGSVYTWSLFNSALSDKLGAPISQVAFSFGLLSLGLAISSSVAGKLQGLFLIYILRCRRTPLFGFCGGLCSFKKK